MKRFREMTGNLFGGGREGARTDYPSAPGYSNDSTSKAAAESVKPTASMMRDTILKKIENGGRTAAEIEAVTGWRAQTITARIRELALLGKVVDKGRRRQTPRGRAAIVWEAVPEAEVEAQAAKAKAAAKSRDLSDVVMGLQSRVGELEVALHSAAETFRHYERLHGDKLNYARDDGERAAIRAKMEANAKMAAMCEAALK